MCLAQGFTVQQKFFHYGKVIKKTERAKIFAKKITCFENKIDIEFSNIAHSSHGLSIFKGIL